MLDRHRARPEARAPSCASRRRCRSGPPAVAGRPAAGRALRTDARGGLLRASTVRSASTPAASSPTSTPTPSSSGGLSDGGRTTRRWSCTGRSSSAEVWAMGSRRGGRTGQARRDHLPRRQHRAGQRVRPLRRPRRGRRPAGHRRRQLPAVLPHPPARGRGRRALHPGLPAASTCPATRTRGCRPPRERSTRRCPRTPSTLPGRASSAISTRPARPHPRGQLPRRGQGDARSQVPSRSRDELRAARRDPVAADPLYTDDELRARSASRRGTARPVDGAIVQADHPRVRHPHAGRPAGSDGLWSTGARIVQEAPWVSAGVPLTRIGQPAADAVNGRERPTQLPGAAASRV